MRASADSVARAGSVARAASADLPATCRRVASAVWAASPVRAARRRAVSLRAPPGSECRSVRWLPSAEHGARIAHRCGLRGADLRRAREPPAHVERLAVEIGALVLPEAQRRSGGAA